MAKLHFYYGTMNSSKSATALMTRYNYIEKGRGVWLIKPSTDTRDGVEIIKSRIGLEAQAKVIGKDNSIWELFNREELHENGPCVDVIICDEAQFLSPSQVTELRKIVDAYQIPVLCYGLKTDFRTHLFPASKRLLELADNIVEIKTICECGEKAVLNARLDDKGEIVTSGEQVLLGGNERYEAMCPRCFAKKFLRRNKGTDYLPEE